MKKTFILMLSALIFLFSLSSIANAAKPIQLNVNGSLLTDLAAPLVKNNVSYVPVRTVESLGYKVVWNSSSKSVSISNQATSNILQLTVGSNIAIKNKNKLSLDTPPIVKSNSIYVPLRFISENFGAAVDWDSNNNGIVVVTPDPTFQETIRSGDLAKARLGVLGLPRVQFYISSERPEGTSFSYIFSEKDYSKLYFTWGSSIYYYEMKNGYMNLVWEGREAVATKNNTSSPLAKYFQCGIETIWGVQPKLTERLVFFNDYIYAREVGEYGIIDTNGTVVFSHKVQEPKQLSDVIVNFPEENQ